MSEDAGKKSGINWLGLLLLSLLIAAAAGSSYLYLPALIPQKTTDIVMIRAGEEPFKTKPVDPGGKIITNQESHVMKMLSELTPETEEIETLLPPSSAPELPPVSVEAKPDADENDSQTTDKVDTNIDSETAAKPAVDNGSAKQSAESDVQVNSAELENAEPTDKKLEKTIVATPKTTKLTSKHITKSRVANDPNEPTYVVQLAAFRKENVAAEQAGLLLKKHEKRLQGATLGTVRIDTVENGVFWRVVSESLPREAADTICASLKRAGQDCILRKFTPPSQ